MSALIDTHCHLDAAEFDTDRDALVLAARDADISAIVIPSISRSNFAAVSAACQRYPGCVPAYGIHPLYINEATTPDLEDLRKILAATPPVAVGEIGLDFFVEGLDTERQQYYFSEQLMIAREYGLPVILHVRRAVDAVLQQLRRIKVRGGIAHAFNGSRQQADAFIELGFKLGFGGAMTYDRALHIRELARSLPLEAIVLETDAPDIPPAWLNRGRNTPAELARIAMELAALRDIPYSEIVTATTRNALAALPGLARVCQA